MRSINSSFYGDLTRWFVGVVEETGTDEPKLGRVRVRIHGVHGDQSQINTADLPLAQVLVPATEPGVSGLGRAPGLFVGATVMGLFLDGPGSQLPIIIGSIPKIEAPTNEQLHNLRTDESLQDALARATGAEIPGESGSDGKVASIQSTLNSGIDALNIVNDETNVQIAFEFFAKTERYSYLQIAAIIGNLLVESGPADIDTSTRDDFHGIAGWALNSSRMSKLYIYAESFGRTSSDLFVQLGYIDWELSNMPNFKGEEFRQKDNLNEATYFFHSNYIRPTFVNEGGLAINNDGNTPNSSNAITSTIAIGQLKKNSEKEALIQATKVLNNFIRKPVQG